MASPSLQPALPFEIGLRVYYEDTDASGVVYHANYLRYCERARTEWLDSLGLDHRGLAEDNGIAFTLADMSMRFVQPARLDDRLSISLKVVEVTRVRVVFAQEIRRGSELLIQGEFTVVCVNLANFRPCRLPDAFSKELR